MKNKILTYLHLDKSKTIILIASYIIFSELIKTKAEVYILEQSLELKLLLFSLVIVLMYKIPDPLIVFCILLLLLLGLFGLQTGFMIYVFLVYSLLRSFKQIL